MMESIAFFSPYLTDHTGGGEKHLLEVARVCVDHGAAVQMCVPMEYTDQSIQALRKRLEVQFGISLQHISFIRSPLYAPRFSWKKIWWTRQFDVLYYVTDGSLFFSFAKKNILHIQIPFITPMHGLINRLKLLCWNPIQTNALFTKKHVEKSWHCHVNQVLYPVVDEELFLRKYTKEKIILGVGRFFTQLHSKRQDVLITAFKQLRERTLESKPWRLVLIGSVEDEEYFDRIRKLAHGLPVSFVTTATRKDVRAWYAKATLFWHAAGFEQSEEENPERVEHFGISTVEAMASNVVPLAVGKGGQKEILTGELADLQWQTIDELVTKTSILLRSDAYLQKFQALVQQRARDFDQSHFTVAVSELFGWKESV